MQKPLFPAILKSGFIVGTADIVMACLVAYLKSGATPDKVLQFVASGFFGTAAFKGGSQILAFGLLFHYIIAFSFTILFFLLYPKIKGLHNNKIITGIVYGIFVWSVMNLLILPLTNIPKSPIVLSKAIINALILIAAIGSPLSFFAAKFYKPRNQEKNH